MRLGLTRVLSILVLLGGAAAAVLWVDYRTHMHGSLAVEEAQRLVVAPGSSVQRVARQLHAMGALERPRYFVAAARLGDKAHRLQAGEYALEPGLSPAQLLQRMVDGRVVLYPFTIVEGWHFGQLMQAIRNQEFLEQTLPHDAEAIMAALGAAGEHPEGRFLPDTYLAPRGTSDLDLLRRAFRAMEVYLEEQWAQRSAGLPIDTPYQALILASIIERETGQVHERHKVAGVFTRRLQLNMRLQTDPTVIYGLGDDYTGRLRRRDLDTDTPYNTYTRHGLPPTPIAMPGRAAIHAALHPEEGEYLYFVSRGDRSHHFSATLQEHNRAVRKYILGR
ncbi:endolytic transglycosylase MltG [Ectothiorhodospiraceae bacterium 2226]|nr:endolytic transglycosylase MltG [Ectothiorhodospiraceae bacterium 2226]